MVGHGDGLSPYAACREVSGYLSICKILEIRKSILGEVARRVKEALLLGDRNEGQCKE